VAGVERPCRGMAMGRWGAVSPWELVSDRAGDLRPRVGPLATWLGSVHGVGRRPVRRWPSIRWWV
jgi:hypothetical protein